jgi:hypothetical protein
VRDRGQREQNKREKEKLRESHELAKGEMGIE